jgi:hypothetical protein
MDRPEIRHLLEKEKLDVAMLPFPYPMSARGKNVKELRCYRPHAVHLIQLSFSVPSTLMSCCQAKQCIQQ